MSIRCHEEMAYGNNFLMVESIYIDGYKFGSGGTGPSWRRRVGRHVGRYCKKVAVVGKMRR